MKDNQEKQNRVGRPSVDSSYIRVHFSLNGQPLDFFNKLKEAHKPTDIIRHALVYTMARGGFDDWITDTLSEDSEIKLITDVGDTVFGGVYSDQSLFNELETVSKGMKMLLAQGRSPDSITVSDMREAARSE